MLLDVRAPDPEAFGLEPPHQVTTNKSACTCDQNSLCGHCLNLPFFHLSSLQILSTI
jgi:hypothetical protein